MAENIISKYSESVQREITFWTGILAKYVGWKIVTPLFSVDNDSGYTEVDIGFRILSPDGTKMKDVWFFSDEEGNAPGRFNAADLG